MGDLEAVVMIALVGLVVYRALVLRRALADPPYRSRALWTGVGALTIVGFLLGAFVDSVVAPVTGFANNYPGLIAQDVVWAIVIFPLLGWIVSNVNVANSADFFHRDTLAWNRAGRFVVPAMGGSWFVWVSLPSWWFSQGFWNTFGLFFTVILVVSLAYVVSALGLTSARIKDREIKTYTKWVGLSVASLVLTVITANWLGFTLLIAMAFCMYGAVRSLAIRTRSLSGLGASMTSA